MSVEDELELVEKPKYVPYERPGIHRTYHAVNTLYLEDIERIYRAIDSTLDERKKKREEDIESFENHERFRMSRYGEEYEPGELPDYIAAPLIQMRNEEYWYKSLDQVAQIPRVGFKQLQLTSGYGGIDVDIKTGQVSLDTNSDEPEFEASAERIHDIITNRQNRLVDFLLFHPVMVGIWVVAVIVYIIASLVPGINIYSAAIGLFVWMGMISQLVYWGTYGRRKFSVVPRYERDARLSFMDKHGTTAQVLVGIVAIIVSVVLWMFPSD